MSESTEFEKGHSKKAVAAKLRRLAEALENDQPFDIQVSGQKIRVPADAEIVFEYERGEDEEELEVEIKWPRSSG